MTFDWDDAYPGHDALGYLFRLREGRPQFKCTLFAIPGLCSVDWCESLPDWIELAVHGWNHETVYECANWTRADMERCMAQPIVRTYFVEGFKAPGWQISDDCYEVLRDHDWWVADQHLEDHRRPSMRVYFYEDGGWHGHIQNVCGNGIEETWGQVVEAVSNADSFTFASEAASFRPHPDDRTAPSSS